MNQLTIVQQLQSMPLNIILVIVINRLQLSNYLLIDCLSHLKGITLFKDYFAFQADMLLKICQTTKVLMNPIKI